MRNCHILMVCLNPPLASTVSFFIPTWRYGTFHLLYNEDEKKE